MQPHLYWTVREDLVLADRDDDNTPLVKINFCNELSTFSREGKSELLQVVAEILKDNEKDIL